MEVPGCAGGEQSCRICFLLVVLMSWVQLSAQQQGEITEVCMMESFNATCGVDEVVVIKEARYGRMRLGRCLVTDIYIGCYDDVRSSLDARCSGRPSCLVSVPDPDLHSRLPCERDFTAFLEVSFTCQQVVAPEANVTCMRGRELELSAPSGFLSSAMTETEGYGGVNCPWVIRLQPGQKVNLTLLEFSPERVASVSCAVRAVVKDGEQTTTICRGMERERTVYYSRGHVVEVRMVQMGRRLKHHYFLLKYQAVGCPHIQPPALSWVDRRGSHVTVRCNLTAEAWHLVCRGTEWVGDIGNCSEGQWAQGNSGGTVSLLPPYGLLAAILIGVVLGICMGLALLGLVLLCFKRRTVVVDDRPCPVEDTTELKEQPNGGVRTPEYGYTHVWEMRSHPTLPQGEPNVHKLSDDKGQTMTKSASYPRNLRSDHVYESPKLDKRLTDSTHGPVYHEFDVASSAVESRRQNTKNNNMAPEVGSDESEEDNHTVAIPPPPPPVVAAQPMRTATVKPRGYRPVPVDPSSPRTCDKLPGHGSNT